MFFDDACDELYLAVCALKGAVEDYFTHLKPNTDYAYSENGPDPDECAEEWVYDAIAIILKSDPDWWLYWEDCGTDKIDEYYCINDMTLPVEDYMTLPKPTKGGE